MSWVFFGKESARKHLFYINCHDCQEYTNIHNKGKCEYCLHYGLADDVKRTSVVMFQQRVKKRAFFNSKTAELAAYKRKLRYLGVEEATKQMVNEELKNN